MSACEMIWDLKCHGIKPALIGEMGDIITYADLCDLGERLLQIDASHPLVMMLCKNTLGAYSGYIALMNAGYPLLMMSAEAPEDMRRQVLNAYRPAMLFLPKALKSEYASMAELCPVSDYRLLKTNFPVNYPVHPELGQLLTTSGSTGSAKLVRQSRKNIRVNGEAIADYVGIMPEDRSVSSLPMQYTYSLSMLSAVLCRGASTVVTPMSFMENDFWDLMENREVTLFHGVPNTYEILHQIDLFSEDFPALKTLTQAGGKLSPELHAWYAHYAAEYGKRLVIMYGQSEATAAIAYLPAERTGEKIGSVGKVIPGGSIELIDEDGSLISTPHTPGEILYRGENVAMGYATCGEDLIKGDEWGGALRTGDVGELDEDGDLYIVGRLKRYIKVYGHRISLDEIDGMILENLNILSASVGTDDHPVIFVQNPRDVQPVRAYICGEIQLLRTVLRVEAIDSFPRNESGKLQYGELLNRAKAISKR